MCTAPVGGGKGREGQREGGTGGRERKREGGKGERVLTSRP